MSIFVHNTVLINVYQEKLVTTQFITPIAIFAPLFNETACIKSYINIIITTTYLISISQTSSYSLVYLYNNITKV